jgi:ABC-2 type transport system ATP-binding protein
MAQRGPAHLLHWARRMIEVNGLVRRFGERVALGGIDFTVPEGTLHGLVGPNGAGKSTTTKILSTLLAPTAGTARVAGHDVVRQPGDVRRAIGVLFQEPTLDDRLTARENLQLHAIVYGVERAVRRRRIDEALEWVSLGEEADRLVRTFSGGMRRRLEIGRALLHRPRVLLLDEPTTGLDPQSRRALWRRLQELVRSERLTILLSTHHLEEAEACDRVAIVDHGRVVIEATPAALREAAGRERRAHLLRPATLEDAYLAFTGHEVRPEVAGAREQLRQAARRQGHAR